jgi:hypothetical protein
LLTENAKFKIQRRFLSPFALYVCETLSLTLTAEQAQNIREWRDKEDKRAKDDVRVDWSKLRNQKFHDLYTPSDTIAHEGGKKSLRI